MSEWKTYQLGELTVNYDGKRKPVKESDRKPGPYPYYGASGIVDYVEGYIFDGDYLLIAEDGENLRTRQTPIAFMAKGKFWVNNHAHIVTGNERADTRFLMYALQISDVNAFLSGAVMPKLTQGNLNRISITCPSIFEQRTIAQILGTLDDKIELNRKINKTLEQIAQAMFKNWFVDFEPVKAKMAAVEAGEGPQGITRAAMRAISGKTDAELDKLQGKHLDLYLELQSTADLFPLTMQESQFGEIPEGWSWVAFGNVIDIFDSRRVPLSKPEREKRKGPYPYYGAASKMDAIDDYLFDGTYVLMAEDGSVMDSEGYPTLQYVWGKFWVNNHAHILKGSDSVTSENILLFLRSTLISPYITGAVQLKINQKNLVSIPFLKADEELHSKFGQRISCLFNQYKNNTDQTINLEALRDALLPRLLSGDTKI